RRSRGGAAGWVGGFWFRRRVVWRPVGPVDGGRGGFRRGRGRGRGWWRQPGGPGRGWLEQVVAGGLQVEFEAGFGVPVVQVAAEAGGQLGGERVGDAGSLPGGGVGFGGDEAGGPLLPRILHPGGVFGRRAPAP